MQQPLLGGNAARILSSGDTQNRQGAGASQFKEHMNGYERSGGQYVPHS